MFKSIGLFYFIFLIETNAFKSTVTLDEYLNSTDFLSVVLSDTDEDQLFVVYQTKVRLWKENRYQYHLYLFDFNKNKTQLITNQSSISIKPIWTEKSFLYLEENPKDKRKFVKIYSTERETTHLIDVETENVNSICYSKQRRGIFYSKQINSTDENYQSEWNDVIQYREQDRPDSIFYFDFQNQTNLFLFNFSLKIDQILCSSNDNKIYLSSKSISGRFENIEDYEIYSFDLNSSVLSQITKNNGVEQNLKFYKNDSIFFLIDGRGSIEDIYKDYQSRIYLLNLTTNQIERWSNEFQGHIIDYEIYSNGFLFLGQLKTSIQIYFQSHLNDLFVQKTFLDGSFSSMKTYKTKFIFIYSSFDEPQEIAMSDSLNELDHSKQITCFNTFFKLKSLPKGRTYQWTNKDDQRSIQGILLYPPDQYEKLNLPLLVHIHGGPYDADLNIFRADWYYSAILFASYGWLVFQPNYRGSTGYGDQFLNEILYEIVSRPGKDILYGIDSLIEDRIANPMNLSIYGFSYGGYLTNWLITQTNRFNAALSGAGAVEHIVDWGTNDLPLVNHYFMGSYPWQKSNFYEKEAAIYSIDKVCTPTHIVTGQLDIRVPVSHSYLLERALKTLSIPCKLLIFPNIGHEFDLNPHHERIKLREELKWLNLYAHQRPETCV